MRGRGEGKGRKERGKEEVREDVGKKDGDYQFEISKSYVG